MPRSQPKTIRVEWVLDGDVVHTIEVDGATLAALRRLIRGDAGLERYDLVVSPVTETGE